MGFTKRELIEFLNELVELMFLRCDEFKRLIIPEHGENGIADFVHDSPNGNELFLPTYLRM